MFFRVGTANASLLKRSDEFDQDDFPDTSDDENSDERAVVEKEDPLVAHGTAKKQIKTSFMC
jgi:hypothetical protein